MVYDDEGTTLFTDSSARSDALSQAGVLQPLEALASTLNLQLLYVNFETCCFESYKAAIAALLHQQV